MKLRLNSKTSLICGLLALSLLACGLMGCRGQRSDKPPIHPNWNMDDQKRFDPQEDNNLTVDKQKKRLLFPNRSAMRKPVKGTVAHTMPGGPDRLRIDDHLYKGRNKDLSYVSTFPKQIKLTRKLLLLGQTKYNIYCTACHGYSGVGNGTVTRYKSGLNVQNLQSKYVRTMKVGQLYAAIYGGRPAAGGWKMPPFRSQLSVKERWAVVAYVRALQLTRYKAEKYTSSKNR